MKKILLALSILAFVLACKSKKLTTASATSSATNLTKMVPTDKELTTAKTIWAQSTIEELKAGQLIYFTKCNTCHENFEIVKFSEKKWYHEIDDMSPKAELSAAEKTKLTQYIISYLKTNKPS